MKFLTTNQCTAWCSNRNFPRPSHPRIYPSEEKHARYDFEIPTDSGHRVALARRLWSASVDSADEERLLWIEEWGVWPSGEHFPLLTALRAGFGERRSLIDVPGHLSEQGDDEDGLSFLIVGLLFLWDCWLYTKSGTVLMLSHDEYGIVFEPRSRSAPCIHGELERLDVLVKK